jgi:hypothetical protein
LEGPSARLARSLGGEWRLRRSARRSGSDAENPTISSDRGFRDADDPTDLAVAHTLGGKLGDPSPPLRDVGGGEDDLRRATFGTPPLHDNVHRAEIEPHGGSAYPKLRSDVVDAPASRVLLSSTLATHVDCSCHSL